MSAISLLIVLVVIGVVIWAATTYIPMDQNIRTLIRIAGMVIALLYVLSAFGVISKMSSIEVPRIK